MKQFSFIKPRSHGVKRFLASFIFNRAAVGGAVIDLLVVY